MCSSFSIPAILHSDLELSGVSDSPYLSFNPYKPLDFVLLIKGLLNKPFGGMALIFKDICILPEVSSICVSSQHALLFGGISGYYLAVIIRRLLSSHYLMITHTHTHKHAHFFSLAVCFKKNK